VFYDIAYVPTFSPVAFVKVPVKVSVPARLGETEYVKLGILLFRKLLFVQQLLL
jgi:hypothetical protein